MGHPNIVTHNFAISNLSLVNHPFWSCISPLFQSESWFKALHVEISSIHMQMFVHLRVNKTNVHMKGFALALSLQQR